MVLKPQNDHISPTLRWGDFFLWFFFIIFALMKLYSLIFALVVGLAISACGNGSTTTTETNDTTTIVVEDTTTTLIDSTEVDSSEVLLDSIVN